VKPLSLSTYYRRHKRSALLLVALICLATLGLHVIVAVLDSIPTRAEYIYLTKVSRVYPLSGDSLEPGVVSQVQTHPDVARIIPDNGLSITPPTLIGLDNLRLMGVSQDDAQYLMDHFGVRLKEGRMFEPRTNQIVLSEEVARALGLGIGDQIDHSIDSRYYGAVPTPLVLVGILEGDPALNPGPSVRVGFASQEYLADHESFAPRSASLLVVAREGRKESVDEFLETTIHSARTEVETYKEVSQLVAIARQGFHLIFGVVNCLVSVVVALVAGVINRIALTRRVEELGLLHAIGYHKNRLISRLTLETVAVAGAGWIAGLGLGQLVLAWLKATLYYAKGMELDLGNPVSFWFVTPIPAVVVVFAAFSVRRIFTRLDPVAIIERGKLSMETERHKRAVKHARARRSSTKPLSFITFYVRHRRRGIMLMMSMVLMILGVTFPVFIISTVIDAMRPSFEHLRYMSEVSPTGGNVLATGVATQIRSHPAVARAIPTISAWLQVLVPPGGSTGVNIYAVSEENLPVLMDLLGIQLVEGRLPRVRSNEIVVSQAAAMNRGLHVGDRVGGSAQERDAESNPLISDDIPIEMMIVGLLSRDDMWLGFASLEYLESHELTASRKSHMLVVPLDGRKDDLDAWLEEGVASAQTDLETYATAYREHRKEMRSLVQVFAGVESIIAIVAAFALATLNYVFFAQRREEFGILHAVGRSRTWLLLRTARETGSVIALAWLIGAAVCMASLVYAQAHVYAPVGLRLNLLSLSPWLFTLPIPLAVAAASLGTIAWMLSRLDPVSVIERR
jgi:ABC-type antimicrobial peptide transport system permease subunit